MTPSQNSISASGRRALRPPGKVLLLVLISMSAILGMVGLVFDAGMMMTDSQNLKQATDAAATAGAMDLLLGKTSGAASATATSYLCDLNGFADAQVTINSPPLQGSFAGRSGYLEVVATRQYETRVMHIVGATSHQTLTTRSVAGYQPSTAASAIMVLDPNPAALSINSIPLVLPSLPALIGGLEVLGLGTVRVDGAVLVNTTWGGVDQNGSPAGSGAGPPYGISCTPLVSLTHLLARDIRVVGGVDKAANYGSFVSGNKSPLQASRMAVPDPYESLPVPSTAIDPANVNAQLRGGVQIVSVPLILAPKVLQPGVYEWIEVVSGSVIFQPGVYIIRSKNPVSDISLNIVAGTVTANGVLFYVTDSSNYDATSGVPDNGDGGTRPVPSVPGLTPSVVINAALLGSNYSGLNDSQSPFNGMLIYQRRLDARPIAVAHESLIGGGSVAGTMYAKWGHVAFTGAGTYDLRIVAGTARLITALGMTIAPTNRLPPAKDVFLVE